MSQVVGMTRTGESQNRGNTANVANTGIGSEDQWQNNRLRYVNDTSARQTSAKRLSYLNKSEGLLLLTCPAYMSFSGSGNYKYTTNDDFVNRRGPNRPLPTFDGTGDVHRPYLFLLKHVNGLKRKSLVD